MLVLIFRVSHTSVTFAENYTAPHHRFAVPLPLNKGRQEFVILNIVRLIISAPLIQGGKANWPQAKIGRSGPDGCAPRHTGGVAACAFFAQVGSAINFCGFFDKKFIKIAFIQLVLNYSIFFKLIFCKCFCYGNSNLSFIFQNFGSVKFQKRI